MGRPRKPPAILVEATVRRNAKLAGLPGDTARLGFFYVVLAEAKLADPPGMFASREHFRELAGRFARYVDDYLRVGVLEPASKLCKKCAERWSSMPPKRGALVVHDWHDHQYDPRKVERQREYEDRQREAAADTISDGISDAVSDAQSDGVSDGISDAVEPEFPTPDSRAPARDRARRTSNIEQRTLNESLSGEDSGARGERADIAALHGRGWTKVTRAQRKVLNEILARHDETGAEFAAAAIRATPADRDPLEAAMTADRLWQDAQRAKAEAEEQGWAEAKATERAEAEGRVAWLEQAVRR